MMPVLSNLRQTQGSSLSQDWMQDCQKGKSSKVVPPREPAAVHFSIFLLIQGLKTSPATSFPLLLYYQSISDIEKLQHLFDKQRCPNSLC